MRAAMSKSMLVERLREAEDRLMTMRQEETMNALVQAKIKLAQADYVNLELQVCFPRLSSSTSHDLDHSAGESTQAVGGG